MLDCPDCEGEECVRYFTTQYYVKHTCEECGHSWEEDSVAASFEVKAVGFSGMYEDMYKVRQEYEKRHGPIRKGWHLHHIDHDSLNNSLENLIAVSPGVHASIHLNPKAYGSRASILALLSS